MGQPKWTGRLARLTRFDGNRSGRVFLGRAPIPQFPGLDVNSSDSSQGPSDLREYSVRWNLPV